MRKKQNKTGSTEGQSKELPSSWMRISGFPLAAPEQTASICTEERPWGCFWTDKLNTGWPRTGEKNKNGLQTLKYHAATKLQSSLVRGVLKGYRGNRFVCAFNQRLYKKITEHSQILKNNTFRPRKQNNFLGKITDVNYTLRETCPSRSNVCLFSEAVHTS